MYMYVSSMYVSSTHEYTYMTAYFNNSICLLVYTPTYSPSPEVHLRVIRMDRFVLGAVEDRAAYTEHGDDADHLVRTGVLLTLYMYIV